MSQLQSSYQLGLILLTAVLVCSSTAFAADDNENNGDVPLKRVVLFNSGVGFFERRGQVEGDAKVDLRFDVRDINDLLKSMVVQDGGDGHISSVTYGSRDPITKTLRTFSIDLTKNPSLADLLEQVRGERVEIEAPNKITGIIVGVETRKKEVVEGNTHEVIKVHYLNLLTPEGLRSVSLESVMRIKLLNEKLDADLHKALEVLATGHDQDKKTVSLRFTGKGKRPVRVGYIQDSPIWKTSYRLVLRDEEAPYLQGWAIVENTTEEDWNNVSLTLVSGRPISFIMDLYQPLYVDRPEVKPELYASLRPQVYEQDMNRRDAEFRKQADDQLQKKAAPAEELARQSRSRAAAPGLANAKSDRAADESFDFKQGMQSIAQAGDVGELFQYSIETPVSLARQRSAMLPIVNDSVKGRKLSIYNHAVQAKHPLNGLELQNTTGLHLMQGPITVFDDGVYAGDARIQDLQPGTKRLISYALDLDTEVAVEHKPQPDQLLTVKVVKGTLHVTHKYRRVTHYTIKNSGKKAKTVLVEQPFEPAWNLITPEKPAEKTRDQYRFEVTAEPGKPAELTVVEERTGTQFLALTNLDDNTIRYYIAQQVVSDKLKAALAEVVKQKTAILEAVQARQRLEQQVNVIDQEQNRIRQNMAQLDKKSDLYIRYVKKFSEQEDQIENLREQIAKLQAKETELRKKLDEYLTNLSID